MYRSSDGHFVSLSGSTNAVFAANARAIDRPDLPAYPRYATNALRVVNAAEINLVFSQWMAQHSLEEILAAFEREQGTIAPILSIAQIFDDPHMRARQAIVEVPDNDFGTVRLHGVVPRFTRDPGEVTSSAGALGEHNREFYVTRLGLSEAELQRLQAQAVV